MYPILFQSGQFVIPSYFAIISLAFLLGQIWSFRRAKHLQMDVPSALDLGLVMMVTGFIGGRLFHVFYEYPEYYWTDPWRVLEIWRGGFVFYGGALLACLCCSLFARIRALPWGPWADFFAPIIIFVYGVGRIASFLSGSCYGRPTDLPWGVSYPQGVEAPPDVPLHPAALYETAWSAVVVVLLLWAEKRRENPKVKRFLSSGGALFFLMLVLHGIGRIGLEHFRGDYRGALILGQTISTWISLVLILIGTRHLLRPAIRNA